MTKSEFLKPWKTHLGFGGGFLALLLFTIIHNATSEEALGRATWHAFSAIRPMEYLMFVGLWYAAAFSRFENERRSGLTALNLGRSRE